MVRNKQTQAAESADKQVGWQDRQPRAEPQTVATLPVTRTNEEAKQEKRQDVISHAPDHMQATLLHYLAEAHGRELAHFREQAVQLNEERRDVRTNSFKTQLDLQSVLLKCMQCVSDTPHERSRSRSRSRRRSRSGRRARRRSRRRSRRQSRSRSRSPSPRRRRRSRSSSARKAGAVIGGAGAVIGVVSAAGAEDNKKCCLNTVSTFHFG